MAETEQFQKKIKNNKYKNLYNKITDYIYPLLRKNPYFGLNIKKFKSEFSGLYRYRFGKFRLFYETDNDKITGCDSRNMLLA